MLCNLNLPQYKVKQELFILKCIPMNNQFNYLTPL